MLKVAVVKFEDRQKTFLYKTDILDLKHGDYVLVQDGNLGSTKAVFHSYTNAISRIKQAKKWIVYRDREGMENGY